MDDMDDMSGQRGQCFRNPCMQEKKDKIEVSLMHVLFD